jgi:nucleoside-triphosphatase
LSSPTRVWLLSGPPGIGKSTVVTKTIYLLRMQGHGIGGCLTKEKREGRERVAFTMTDLMSGREGELASVKSSLGPRVGRYRVNLATLTDIGARSLREATERAEVIAIDEVGPMELTSQDFRRAADGCFRSGKPILAIVHELMKDPLIESIREMEGKTMIEVTLANREKLPQTISEEMLALLAQGTGEA